MLNTTAIKLRREGLGLSQDEAAARADIAGGRAKWNDIEKGRNENPSLRTLLGMARALQCSIADLVSEPHPPRAAKRGRKH
jgi:transcriptional regulator with XRE-family HTH domain